MAFSIRYDFTQEFRFPAEEVFKWCTNYSPGDLSLMGEKGKRRIEKISKDTYILTDSYPSGRKNILRKKKMVNLYPDTLSWVSTHLIGKTKHSQFLYRVSAEGPSSSRVFFTGLQIEYDDKKKFKMAAMSEELKKEDSHAWELLAQEMERDVGGNC